MILISSDSFSFQTTLLIALIGAVIGQSLVILISWIKKAIDLNQKKQMIINDLNNHSKILDNLINKHLELKNLFEHRKIEEFTTNIFHDLQLDIYQSVAKNELYSIFKKDLVILVDIYKSIEFLKERSPYWIYGDYLEKSELHLEETKNDENHEFYCENHLGFMDTAIKNIDNNIKTIMDTKSKIQRVTN